MYQKRCYLLFVVITLALVGLCLAAFIVLFSQGSSDSIRPTGPIRSADRRREQQNNNTEAVRPSNNQQLTSHDAGVELPFPVSKLQNNKHPEAVSSATLPPSHPLQVLPAYIRDGSNSNGFNGKNGGESGLSSDTFWESNGQDPARVLAGMNELEYSTEARSGAPSHVAIHGVTTSSLVGPLRDQLLPSIADVLEDPRAAPKNDVLFRWTADGHTLLMHGPEGNFLLIDTDRVLAGSSLAEAAKPFLSRAQLEEVGIRPEDHTSFQLSANQKYVAFATHSQKIFRRSKDAEYVVVRVENGRIAKFNSIRPPHGKEASASIQLFNWNHAVGTEDFVFVYGGNLFYQSNLDAVARALTSDGGPFRLYGLADWLYEEEILPSPNALWWSESGRFLAYALFDDSNTTKVTLPVYGNSREEFPDPRAEWKPKPFRQIPYPLAGTPNQPGVFLFLWDKLATHQHDQNQLQQQLILPPEELFEHEPNGFYYLFAVHWMTVHRPLGSKKLSREEDTLAPDDEELEELLVVVWANRLQNRVAITSCRPEHGPEHTPCTTVLQFSFTDICGMSLWAEPKDFQAPVPSRTGLFFLLPRERENNVFNAVVHLDLVSALSQEEDGKAAEPKLHWHGGAYDVDELAGYDQERDELFFFASLPNGENMLGQRHLFRVPMAAAADDQHVSPQCVTCVDGPRCPYASASRFAPLSYESGREKGQGRKLLLFCESPFEIPIVQLRSTANITHKVILCQKPVEDSSSTTLNSIAIGHPITSFHTPTIRLELVRLASGLDARVRLLFPPDMHSSQKYPVLINVYAGPNTAAAQLTTPWPLLSYFASVRRYVVVQIDGRGAAGGGWSLRAPIYGHLGGPEISDQLETLGHLLVHHEDMDANRVAVFGWSYGGFAALHIGARADAAAMSSPQHESLVRCAVAVAPVVDYHLYDSAYTERYLRMPADDPLAYAQGSLIGNDSSLLDAFSRVHLMLAHGIADDNVHFRHSAYLIRRLQARGIHFVQHLYPDEDHSIGGQKSHLYNEIDAFLGNERCLGPSTHSLHDTDNHHAIAIE